MICFCGGENQLLRIPTHSNAQHLKRLPSVLSIDPQPPEICGILSVIYVVSTRFSCGRFITPCIVPHRCTATEVMGAQVVQWNILLHLPFGITVWVVTNMTPTIAPKSRYAVYALGVKN